MKAKIDLESGTCDSEFLATIFGTTARNVLYMVSRGMPVLQTGSQGRNHTFKASLALHWYLGQQACRQWNIDLPGQLETVLTGHALGQEKFHDFSASAWVEEAQELAAELGYSKAEFDRALQFIITKNLIRW